MRASSMSSKPITTKSVGTSTPWSFRARMAPIAMTSFAAKTAKPGLRPVASVDGNSDICACATSSAVNRPSARMPICVRSFDFLSREGSTRGAYSQQEPPMRRGRREPACDQPVSFPLSRFWSGFLSWRVRACRPSWRARRRDPARPRAPRPHPACARRRAARGSRSRFAGPCRGGREWKGRRAYRR
jgi:hypothetical protein